MEKFLTPDGYVLSVAREDGVYFIGWITIDHEEGQALEKVSTPLPPDTEVTPGGKYRGSLHSCSERSC